MNRNRHSARYAALLGAAALLWAAGGCQTGGKPPLPVETTASATSQPGAIDVLAQSDAERAKAAIQRDQQERAGQRRPFEPGSGPVVDQPRVGGRR